MKPTQVAELFANIKKTFVSFFSIIMFVALGVGVFLGISWMSPVLEHAADTVFDQGNMHHIQVSFPYGLTDDDIQKLSDIEGVTAVEKARQAFASYDVDGRSYMFKLQTLPVSIDMLSVKQGALPQQDGEMAVKQTTAEELGLSVGDTITFVHDADGASGTSKAGKDGMEQLTRDTFTVTALVESPDYISANARTLGFSTSARGAVDGIGWVMPGVFDDEQYQNAYTLVQIRCDSLVGVGETSFSSEYQQASAAIEAKVSELGDTLGPARYDSLHGQAQAKLAEAEKKYNEGQLKVKKGKRAIEDGTAKLESGRKELEQKRTEGEQKLEEAHQKLLDGEAQKTDGEQQLEEARAKVADGREKIDEVDALKTDAEAAVSDAEEYEAQQSAMLSSGEITQKQYNDALDERGAQLSSELEPYAAKAGTQAPQVDHTNYLSSCAAARALLGEIENTPVEIEGESMTLAEARQRLEQAEEELAAAEDEYEEKVTELNDGWEQYYAGQRKLEAEVAKAEKQLSDGEAKLKAAKKRVKEGQAKLDEMKPQLDAAKAQVDAMKKYSWTVSERSTNAGAMQIATFSGITSRLSFSMAALFVIVGLLVTYSAVGRIVHEQITQIGTKKALGLRNREITLSFLLYAAIAVLVGAVIGAVVGFTLVESIIIGAISSQFTMDVYQLYFGWPLFAAMTLLELVLVLASTWLACRTVLRENAVELLKGEKPPEAKTRFYEKWGVWDKLPLFTQTIVNNCVNDKRRVFSTVVGVAGCTALIVTAITLSNDVMTSYDVQYDHVYAFNGIAYTDTSVEGSLDEAQALLREQGATTTKVLRKSFAVQQADGTDSLVQVIVAENDDEFKQLYHINVVEGEPYDPESDGVWVTRAFAEHLGAKVNDLIELDGGGGEVHTVRIAGFFEFYLTYHEVIMGRSLYEREFGTGLLPNAVLADTHDKPVDELGDMLAQKVAGFDSMVDDKVYEYRDFKSFSSISNAVVLIYLALATLMAVVVLLNLNVMFIEEKKRDLIVLMINGFSAKDAKRYIYNDTFVLSVIGILLGLLLGVVMGSVTVGSIEPNTASFVKSPSGIAIAAGIVGSAVLAFVMSVIALRRIPRFDLTDINRF